MNPSPTPPSKLWPTVSIWLAFAGIALLHFLGLAAEQAIPFGPPMSIASVMRRVSISDMFGGHESMIRHGVILTASIGALIVYQVSRSCCVRGLLASLCLLAPLYWMADGIKGVAQWLLAMPVTPYFTFTVLAGTQDGEFYSEGFLIYTAIGWWMIFWSVLLWRDALAWRRLQTSCSAESRDK